MTRLGLASLIQLGHFRPIYNEIVVLPSPALEVFATYGPDFEQDNELQSFTDAMRRPDHKLWWEAFCNEIRAIVTNNTWTLTDLPPGFKALPSNGSVIQNKMLIMSLKSVKDEL